MKKVYKNKCRFHNCIYTLTKTDDSIGSINKKGGKSNAKENVSG